VLRVFCSRKEHRHAIPTNWTKQHPPSRATGTTIITDASLSPHWTNQHRELAAQEKKDHLRCVWQAHGDGCARRNSVSTDATATRRSEAPLASGALSHRADCIASPAGRADAARCTAVSVAANPPLGGPCRCRFSRVSACVQAPVQVIEKAIITQKGFLYDGESLFAMPNALPLRCSCSRPTTPGSSLRDIPHPQEWDLSGWRDL
jgi:hypothetical protein